MTLPNKLTVGRLVMAPLFFIMFNLRYWVGSQVTMLSSIVCLVLFVAIEMTDLLDGKIARHYHLVTDLGKVMDPFGDTLSHLTYFVCFMISGIMPSWVFVVIMYREFAILFIRLLMVSQGHVMPANMWGKSKTVTYAVGGVLGIFYLLLASMMEAGQLSAFYTCMQVVFALSAIASVVSFLNYIRLIIRDGSLSQMTR
ncbi:MAG: CDP-diacylglycerol--glycerol-3-phosphate 3-phosphatidyltransferase [Sphaerochaetaceae bacterium]|nr:CDP-diacylglycerol--glycerol-3-phosphate 3-phosphatidyltransferase [Spirochaetales bacterium]MDY5500574.1 CDP-diacylglycerol--glycerol-3-phosphate 3-phosphatidyltransferase [Sphaerochaetaceae bacterium]